MAEARLREMGDGDMDAGLVMIIALECLMIIAFIWVSLHEYGKRKSLRGIIEAVSEQGFRYLLREYMDAYVFNSRYYKENYRPRGEEEESFFHHVHVPMQREMIGTVKRSAFKGKVNLVLVIGFSACLVFSLPVLMTIGPEERGEFLPIILVPASFFIIYVGVKVYVLRGSKRDLELLSEVDRRLVEYRGGVEPPPYRTSVKELAREMTESAMGRKATKADFYRYFQPEIPTFDPESDLYLGERGDDEAPASDTGRE